MQCSRFSLFREVLDSSSHLTENQWDVKENPTETSDEESASALECPHCGGCRLKLIAETSKPIWKGVFWRESETCPSWYAALQRDDHRRFWTSAYGEEFYDWYLETQVEGAKETEPAPPPPNQPYIPGMTPSVSFTLESF